MKNTLKTIALLIVFIVIASCGNSEKKEEKEQVKLGDYSKQETKTEVKATSSADMIDMSNKGIGPIKSVTLAPDVDQALAAHGQEVYNKMCTACHKPTKKFIGPAPIGVLERRSPEWVMNMILNPEEMIANDPIAKQLLIEANMAVMANQNLTEADARAVLEYFRTIK